MIKGAGDGEVIFDGNGNFNLFNVKAANYNYFEGVTIRNTDIAIWAGTQFIAGSKGLNGQEVPLRERRIWVSSRTTRDRATSTSPTTTSSAATIRIT